MRSFLAMSSSSVRQRWGVSNLSVELRSDSRERITGDSLTLSLISAGSGALKGELLMVFREDFHLVLRSQVFKVHGLKLC